LPCERQQAAGQLRDEMVHGFLLAPESCGGDSCCESPEVVMVCGGEV
jgi:hypothetical protein